MTHSLPLDRIPSYSPELSRISTESGVLLKNSLDDLRSLRSPDRFTPEHREALVEAVMTDLNRWNAPGAARDAVMALRDGTAYAVVTGQQAGIATGPLYTLYKAVGAVLAARELERLHPDHRFVPIFWSEADDHDFDEVRRLTLLNRAGDPVTLAYDDGVERPLHVGDRKVDLDRMQRLVEELRQTLLPTEFTETALGIVEAAYGNANETLADGFARSLYAILGETPLVVVSSRNPGLKRLAADVFAAEAREPKKLYDALASRTEALKKEGWNTPIVPKIGGLFITHEGERRSLDYEDGSYRIRGAEVVWDAVEAAERAEQSPELFSPNVALRPIVQDAIFPTALYLGGPGEVAYLNQLRDAYQVFGLEAPAIAPRPFVLLLEAKVLRALDARNIPLLTLLADDFDAPSLLIDKTLAARLDESTERALGKLVEAYREMEEITKMIDPTLEKTLGALGAGATKGVEDFSKRLRSAMKKKESTEIEKLGAAREMVMPNDSLQERELNALYFIDKYGVERFRAALERIEMCSGELQVVEV